MTPSSPTGLIEALAAAWNTHDAEQLASLYAPDYRGEDVGEAGPVLGRAAVRRSAERYLTAFPDLRFEVERTIVQDRVVVLVWRARGTHTGALIRIPPSGRSVQVRGVSVLDVEAGQVRRGSVIWDLAGLLRDVGLLPDLQDEA